MSKNNHKEAIGLLFSGKSMKPVLIEIAQIAPAVFIRAFRECYPDPNAKNNARILAAARCRKIDAIKIHRDVYKSSLMEAKEAVEKLMADNGI